MGPARSGIELHGPVRAWVAGAEANLGPARQCAVLALLAVNAGRPVSDAAVIDGVWGYGPPASGIGVVQ
jgi:DNA-binding response OmpR family regulator